MTASSHRRGELLAAAGAAVLLVLLFALKWYGPGAITSSRALTTTVNGWHALIHLRWLILLTILAAFALLLAGVAGRRPALVLALSMTLTLLGIVTTLWLGYRVLISIPPGQKPAAYLGLACMLAIVLGGCLSTLDQWRIGARSGDCDRGS